MSNFKAKITCCDCGADVEHVCKPKQGDLREAILAMLSWAPEDGFGDKEFYQAYLEHGRKMGWLAADEDPNADANPSGFMGTQAWSYALFGTKNDARSFHAVINSVIRACGFDLHEMRGEVDRRLDTARAEAAKQREWQRVRTGFRMLLTREQRIALVDAAEAEGLEIVKAAFPGEPDGFYDAMMQYVRIQKDFVARDGVETWLNRGW